MTQKEKNIILHPLEGLNDEKKLEEVQNRKPSCAALGRQGLAAVTVSICSAVVGFSSAYSSPALASMNQPESRLHITLQEASWIGSLMPLCALLGGVLGGPLIESFGRKMTIFATTLPFTLSFLLISYAVNIPMIMVGRAITGFCVGVSSLALPVYLGETLQPEVRGMFGLFPTTIGNFGILLAFFLGKYLDWSELALFGALLPVPYFIMLFFIPETPSWYISKEKETRAKMALQWFRGSATDITKEYAELIKIRKMDNETVSFKELFSRKYIWPLCISIGLMFFQQLSGINAVIFYTVNIFRDAGSTIDSNICAIIVGCVNLGSTLVATALIDRVGRKVLMYISNTVMALTLFTLGTFFYLKDRGTDLTEFGWIPLVSFVLFVIGFSIGAGPIPWLMMGEILPSRVRGIAASLVTGFNWSCTFIVTKTFIDLTEAIGSDSAFWLFGIICVVGLFFVIFFVPETRGKTLEDIEKEFRPKDLRSEDSQEQTISV
ncbi:facilitated trehalose transporter Tret1-like isoform X2 [Cimex lectularius]|nr:facilitated trehalose transporter Tret1-like isoform X2 [Cimex lectularius]